MIDALAIPRTRGASPFTGARVVGLLEAERLAIVSTATAIALLPLLRPAGPANTAPLDVFIGLSVGACFVWALVSRQRWRFAYVLPMALFVVGGALGALAGPVPARALIALTQDLWVLAWCICIANVCRTPQALALLLRTWIVASLVWAVLLLIGEYAGNAYLAGTQSNEGGRTSLTFGDANFSANYFFLSMMFIAATRYPRKRPVRLLAYALLLPPWALSGSNSGIVELSLGITLIAAVALYRRFGAVPTVAIGCFFLLFAVAVVPQIPLTRIQNAAHDSQYRLLRDWVGRSQRTAGQRKELLRESVVLYYKGGFLGTGPTSTIKRLATTQAPFAREAHDDYLAALVERGVIGAAGVLLLVGSVLARAGSLVRRQPSAAFAEVVPRTAPILAAVIGTLVLGTVYEVLHGRHVWALFGIVAGLAFWSRE